MPAITPRLSGLEPVIRHAGPPVGQHTQHIVDQLARVMGDAAKPDRKSGPLVVIELGAVIAGPFAGSLMADLGCDVIKIETPGAGDSLRKMGPSKSGIPIWFGTSARDKKCVTLNLKHPAGQTMFKQLIAQADVLVENFRPGVLERLGLDWDALKQVNPRLVMLSISGFGQTGAQKLRPGFGKIAEGLSGVVNLTGEAGQSPLFVGFSLADASAGLFGVFGVAAALYRRDVLGAGGGRIDVALYEPLIRMLDCQLALHAQTGFSPARSGGNDPYSFGLPATDRPRFRCVESGSGSWYLLAIPTQHAWEGLEHLDAAALSDAQLEAALGGLSIDFTPVFDGMSLSKTAYFRSRADVIAADHPLLGLISAPGRLTGSETRPVIQAPALGEHNRVVFGQMLGLGQDELDRLTEQGVI
jgi:crotonobetainyl-CoA:carnitine CoA-transferase CaiB-like acyl-CoA transferase